MAVTCYGLGPKLPEGDAVAWGRILLPPSSFDDVVLYLGVLGLLALGICRLLLQLGLLDSFARLLELLGDLVGRRELLALGLLAVLFCKEVVQIRHGDAATLSTGCEKTRRR